jgi:hypothetical protein
MSSTDNPDAVVALAANVIGISKPRNSLRFLKPDFRHGLSSFVDDRAASVMDSIASICVSEARSSVVAVAFIVAANDQKQTPGIVDHLKTVWNLLKGISDLTLSGLQQEGVDMKLDS